MEETMTNAPICKTQTCKRPLTHLKESNCWRCLVCNPIRKIKPQPKQEKAFLDVKLTEKRAREIAAECIAELVPDMVRQELENWHIQKPSVTKEEIEEVTSTNTVETPVTPETFLQKAKRLGVRTHYKSDGVSTGGMRKKVDILADTEKYEKDEEL